MFLYCDFTECPLFQVNIKMLRVSFFILFQFINFLALIINENYF